MEGLHLLEHREKIRVSWGFTGTASSEDLPRAGKKKKRERERKQLRARRTLVCDKEIKETARDEFGP